MCVETLKYIALEAHHLRSKRALPIPIYFLPPHIKNAPNRVNFALNLDEVLKREGL